MDKIIQWNCRGCVNNYCYIKQLMHENDPMCLALQETWLRPNQPYNLRGYSVVRQDLINQDRAHGGVAMFLRTDVLYSRVNILSDLQVIAIKVKSPVNITLCNIYLPDTSWEIEQIDHVIDQLAHPYVIMGDFNAHNILWGSIKTDIKGRILERWLQRDDIALLNTGAKTHFNTKSNDFSAIDLTIASSQLLLKYTWSTDEDLHNSDHFPIHIQLDKPKVIRYLPIRWNTAKADWKKFKNSLKLPTEQTVEKITESILTAANKSIPTSGGKPFKRAVPWWNEETKNVTEQKKRALNKFKKYPTTDNLIAFKQARATARKVILKNKRDSWNEYTSTITPDIESKTMWTKIKAVSGINTSNTITSIQTETNSITEDPVEIANIIATHFENVSHTNNYEPNFLQIKNNSEISINFNTENEFAYNSPFTIEELESEIQKTKIGAPGPDTISNDMLKNLTPEVKDFLLRLYNKLWDENVYPESWKEATIVPIPKPNKNKMLPSNLRPISLTCCMGKLFERMVNTRLQMYLENNNFLVTYQAGYRKKRSTIDHLVLLEHSIQEAFRKREHLIAVFFDIKGAFDMTWRHGILDKLWKFGLRGKLPLLIKSFLENRLFKVRVGNEFSTSRILQNGVPQGSTLSCTLFAIAINDICNGLNQEVQRCIYVDDLAIFCSGKTVGQMTKLLQPSINKIIENGHNIGFQFSKEKTKCVHFCRLRKPHYDPLLFLNEYAIQCVDTIKFLGLMFDKKLTWHEHIDMVSTKCRQSLNILKVLAHTQWGADPKSLLTIYKTLIRSKIDYGSIVYSSARKSQLKKLDKIQNISLRYCLNAFPTTPIQSLYCESAIMPLEQRRKILINSYIARVRSYPKHPNNNFLFPNENMYSSKDTITRPLAVRNLEYLESINVELPDFLTDNEIEGQPVSNLSVSKIQFINTVKEKIIKEWQYTWNSTDTLLRRLEPIVKSKYEATKLRRLEAIKAFRLRTGHTNLTHQHILKGEPTPVCEQCQQALSVIHIIGECPKFNIQRQIYNLNPLIEENLKIENIINTLEFLKCLGLFEKI